jgi:hypothetical protein
VLQVAEILVAQEAQVIQIMAPMEEAVQIAGTARIEGIVRMALLKRIAPIVPTIPMVRMGSTV